MSHLLLVVSVVQSKSEEERDAESELVVHVDNVMF